MQENTLFDRYIKDISNWFEALPDKPEETIESTLKALWMTAAGAPLSAEKAIEQTNLPELNTEQERKLDTLIQQRKDGTPLAHLSGRQQFFGIELISSKQALVPRKETEILAQAALDALKNSSVENPIIVDVCTGSGNLALAIACQNANYRVYASDLSQEAVELAKENRDFLGLTDQVEIRQGDLIKPFMEPALEGKVDLLTCNPPYISTAKVEKMHEEISNHEPSLAFDGGAFGIKILQRLVSEAPALLKSGGAMAFEVGLGQGPAMKKRFMNNDAFSNVESYSDENGDIRVIIAIKK